MLRTGIANKGFSGGFSGVFQRKQMPERRDIFLNIQLSDALKEGQISSILAGKTVGVAVIAPAVVEKAVSKTVTAIGEYLAEILKYLLERLHQFTLIHFLFGQQALKMPSFFFLPSQSDHKHKSVPGGKTGCLDVQKQRLISNMYV